MKSVLCGSLLCGAAGPWSAPLAAQSLTLDVAIERAVEAAPELRAGEASVDAARARFARPVSAPTPRWLSRQRISLAPAASAGSNSRKSR